MILTTDLLKSLIDEPYLIAVEFGIFAEFVKPLWFVARAKRFLLHLGLCKR